MGLGLTPAKAPWGGGGGGGLGAKDPYLEVHGTDELI